MQVQYLCQYDRFGQAFVSGFRVSHFLLFPIKFFNLFSTSYWIKKNKENNEFEYQMKNIR